MSAPMLQLDSVDVRIGQAQILFGVTLEVGEGEAVVLAGRNGAGKSTTIKAAMGLLQIAAGSVRLRGERIDRLPAWKVARAGLGYVPEDRRVFGELTVRENLEVGRLPIRGARVPWTPARLFGLFPALSLLAERPARFLSGGEQQMLAVARTLMGNPQCLLLDEPTEGLAPLVVEQMAAALGELKSHGLSLLIAEQNLRFAARVADRACIVESGVVRHQSSMQALMADEATAAGYLAL